MPQERRNSQITIRIPRRMRAALEREATRQHRTVADVVNLILGERYLARRRSAKARIAKGRA